jgi:hypothetical protein
MRAPRAYVRTQAVLRRQWPVKKLGFAIARELQTLLLSSGSAARARTLALNPAPPMVRVASDNALLRSGRTCCCVRADVFDLRPFPAFAGFHLNPFPLELGDRGQHSREQSATTRHQTNGSPRRLADAVDEIEER